MSGLSNPLFKFLEIAFFFFAISHGLNGLGTFIEDYVHNHTYKRFLSLFTWVFSVLLFLSISVIIILL
jgi:succinate dehydrogenase hydrophobic anchor subunit